MNDECFKQTIYSGTLTLMVMNWERCSDGEHRQGASRSAGPDPQLGGRTSGFALDTPLLGAVPELGFDGRWSSSITALVHRFGLQVDDDEIDGAVFQTWGSPLAFVRGKLAL